MAGTSPGRMTWLLGVRDSMPAANLLDAHRPAAARSLHVPWYGCFSLDPAHLTHADGIVRRPSVV